ncbi:MAG TPA: hypothetical protein VFJ82_03755, partial [Longimicrobium sp.]|nr:hypothetical protein [Longimicrobium sp.]
MSNDEVSNEGGAAYLADPDESVQNTPEAEFAPLETEAEPRVEPGSVGDEKIVTGQLDGTGLDLVARRVLARRGIDPARLARAPGAGRGALPDGGG